MMNRRTLYIALLAIFVGASSAAPLQAQSQEGGVPAPQKEKAAPDRIRLPVTIRVRNDGWSDMRIYVVAADTQSRPRRLGTVTALTTRSFEIPDNLRVGQGTLVLVAVALSSREQQSTRPLQTWPGSRVEWNLGTSSGLSLATVYHARVSP